MLLNRRTLLAVGATGISSLLYSQAVGAGAERAMRRVLPDWVIPDDLEAIVTKQEEWISDRWAPIRLVVMGATIYHGRPIPLSWQIEFSPYGPEFDDANRRIAKSTGNEPDSYAWSELVLKTLQERAPSSWDKRILRTLNWRRASSGLNRKPPVKC